MVERRRFSDELKAEAIRMVIRDGMAHAEVSRKWGISNKTIGGWVVNDKDGTAGIKGTPSVAVVLGEVARLRKERARSKMEAEPLKKATAYFARESHPGMRS